MILRPKNVEKTEVEKIDGKNCDTIRLWFWLLNKFKQSISLKIKKWGLLLTFKF